MGDDVSLEESVLTFVRDVMRLSPHLTDITVQGLVAAFRSLNLAVESNDLLGSRNVANNSKSAYHKHIRGLFKFLSMIGDYVSLLVLYNGTLISRGLTTKGKVMVSLRIVFVSLVSHGAYSLETCRLQKNIE
jgi:hypothetical protein